MDMEKIKLGSWSALGGTAAATAREIAANTVADRLGAICADRFNRDSEKNANLREMKEKDRWGRGRYIEKQSWAIMPGEDKVDSKVADACANHLTENPA
jgi:hypothetical protein